MQKSPHESSRRDDNRLRTEPDSEICLDAGDPVVFHEKARHISLLEIQAGLVLEKGLEAKLVSLLVTLGTGRPDTRSFRRIQHPELDARGVRVQPHHAAERIDFSHHMALGESANGWIAGHLADGIGILGKNEGFAAQSGGSHCRFDPRMTGADYHDVVWLGIFEVAQIIPWEFRAPRASS